MDAFVLHLPLMEAQPRKLLDQVRDQIRLKHYSYRTGQTYVYWIRRYILFHQKRHPAESRITMLPTSLIEDFQRHLQSVQQLHQRDLAQGCPLDS